MNSSREERLERLFEKAMALPPENRAHFVRATCEDDEQLRDALTSLLSHADAAAGFLDRMAATTVARVDELLSGTPPRLDDGGTDALEGRTVAHFRILERLGGGGMGLVYRATDLRLGRVVALKFLPPHLGADEQARTRFVHEAKAASALDHPNICAIHEIGETEAGQLFIAMPCYDGSSLKERIAAGPIPHDEALDYAGQVAEGLQRAHDAGIVHRDVKPANIVLTAGGRVKIVDFGVAKIAGTEITRVGTTMGTVAYMSPEQTRGDAVDARSDIWSFGAVLYEMLEGRRPFCQQSDETLIHAIRHDAPRRLSAVRSDLRSGVAALIGRCLEKEAARRYPDVRELLRDLRTVQRGGRIRRPPDVSRLRAAGGAVAIAGLLLLLGWQLQPRADRRITSLAVLPVRAPAVGVADANLAEGMVDLLIAQLSELSALRRVVSRSSVSQLERSGTHGWRIGRELGVDALVELSLSRDGENARVDVALIESGGGKVRWNRRFERPVREVLSLQREMAQTIARELQLALTPSESARLVGVAPTVRPEAFALYLLSARSNESREATRYLEQAIAADSTFALAYAKVAIPYIMLERDGARAERAIGRALSLDPGLSAGYDALGLLRLWIDRDWGAAESAFSRALELDPHNGLAHHELAQLNMRRGRCDAAIAGEEKAVIQNPGIAHFQSGLAEVHLYCRQYGLAIAEFERTLPLVRDSGGVYFLIGDAYYFDGQFAKARAFYAKTPWPVPGWAEVALGTPGPARAQIVELSARWARGQADAFTAWTLARLHASLLEKEAALTWLERSHASGHGMVLYLKVQPQFDMLRAEPRFQALLQKVGLTE